MTEKDQTQTSSPPPSVAGSSEELDAKLFDYHEGTLSPAERAEVERLLAARGEPIEPPPNQDERYQSGLMSLRAAKAPAPATFTAGVTDTIHRRSAGRFFGRRTLGDRVPFGVLLIVAMVIALAVAAILWSSSTGSLTLRRNPAPSAPPGGAREVMQPPAP